MTEAVEPGARALFDKFGTYILPGRVNDPRRGIDEAKEAGRKSILLLIRRGGDPRFVALGIED